MNKTVYTATIIILLVCFHGCRSAPPEPVITETPTQIPTPSPTLEPTPTPGPTIERPYYIEIIPRKTGVTCDINPFSFIHTYYAFVFYKFNLTSLIPFSERIDILKTIYNEVCLGAQVNLVIKKYLDVDKLLFVFFTETGKNPLILSLKTNYDEGACVLVPLDMPNEEWKRCVSIFHSIIDSYLVHDTSMFSIKIENDLLKENEFIKLAHLYIFDEKKDNDSQAELYLNNIIENNSDKKTILNALYELIHYYLLHGNIQNAETSIKRANSILSGTGIQESYNEFKILGEKLKIFKSFMEKME